jgi:hypothetical protein
MAAVSRGRLRHYELDLAVLNGSHRERVASHLFDGQPIREKVSLRLHFRWECGLQNTALPRVSIRNLKGDCLGSLCKLLFGGLGKLAHAAPS